MKKYYDFGQIEAYLETRDILRERTIPYRIDPKMTLITERLEPISDYNKYLLMKVQLLLDYEKYIVELALKSIK